MEREKEVGKRREEGSPGSEGARELVHRGLFPEQLFPRSVTRQRIGKNVESDGLERRREGGGGVGE